MNTPRARRPGPASTRRLAAIVAPVMLVTVAAVITLATARPAAPAPGAADAFATVARVLRHPRCLNCHPSGDVPRVGEERRLHAMNVQRGRANHGAAGQSCFACHQSVNQDFARVPGAPQWHLAPPSMGWEGLDDHDLAEALKDPVKNGDRTLEDLRRHMERDPLVRWAWSPGAGRAAPPIPHAEFAAAVRAWIEAGAPSPPPGTTTY